MARETSLWPLRIGALLTVSGLAAALLWTGIQLQPDRDLIPVHFRPRLVLRFDFGSRHENEAIAHNNMNFGLLAIDEGNGPATSLFFGDRGHTNNTLLKIDGATSTFGKEGTGEWVQGPTFTPWGPKIRAPEEVRKGGVGTWQVGKIQVTQQVQIVPGVAVRDKAGEQVRFYDTCLVTYKINNKDNAEHEFGMRILLDTMIGENSRIGFRVEGEEELEFWREFTGKDVPDSILALQHGDPENPGFVAELNLHHPSLEPPDRLLLTSWPGKWFRNVDELNQIIEEWYVLLTAGFERKKRHSAIAMYWPVKQLAAGQTRELGYSYGVVTMQNYKGGRIRKEGFVMTVGGDPFPGKELSVAVVIANPVDGEMVTLSIDDISKGAELTQESKPWTQQVPPRDVDGRPMPIIWRLRATETDGFTIRVTTSTGIRTSRHIRPFGAGW